MNSQTLCYLLGEAERAYYGSQAPKGKKDTGAGSSSLVWEESESEWESEGGEGEVEGGNEGNEGDYSPSTKNGMKKWYFWTLLSVFSQGGSH